MTFFAPKKQEQQVVEAKPVVAQTEPTPSDNKVNKLKKKTNTLLTSSLGVDDSGESKTLLG
jgi:hypothetical protein